MSRRTKGKAGSTAHDIARVRAVRDGILFIAPTTTAGQTQARMRGVAVIEVEGSTFTLRSEEDRASLVLGYQALLKAIPPGRSVQLLIRRRPHDLSAYIQKLDALATERRVPPIYRQLASAHADHLEQISGSRPLYRSRCYLVVSAVDQHQPSFALSFLREKRRQADQQSRKQAIQDDLGIQCERYLAALANMGLSAHRLHDDELTQLAASCLVPARDDQ
jgi:hypothetical protein